MSNVLGTITGAVTSAAIEYAVQDTSAQQLLVNAWLDNIDTSVGNVIHIGAMLAAQATAQAVTPLAGTKGRLNNLVSSAASILSIDPQVAAYMNEVATLLQQPNIEGITIFAESEQVTRETDVSENPLICQSRSGSTTYAIDNAVPHPRTWTIKGHLTTIMPTDHYFVIKPSLQMQAAYLDSCMVSRRPVMYKTYDNIFHLVLIKSFTGSWDPKSMNTYAVNIVLKEYVPFEVYSGSVSAAALLAGLKRAVS